MWWGMPLAPPGSWQGRRPTVSAPQRQARCGQGDPELVEAGPVCCGDTGGRMGLVCARLMLYAAVMIAGEGFV